jgi:hypothetical protein
MILRVHPRQQAGIRSSPSTPLSQAFISSALYALNNESHVCSAENRLQSME